VREEDTGGRETVAPLDLKMQLEDRRADERVSRGQASERSVCVCEAVSVEMGARHPPLQMAVVCPPGCHSCRRLAITAVFSVVFRAVLGKRGVKLDIHYGLAESAMCHKLVVDFLRSHVFNCRTIRFLQEIVHKASISPSKPNVCLKRKRFCTI
jgi:hypothetical protein